MGTPLPQPVPRSERIVPHPVEGKGPVGETVGWVHLLRALYLMHDEQVAAAVPELRLAGIYDEHSPFLQEKLASAYLASNDVARGEWALQEGLREHPQDPGLNSLAGQLALEAQDYRTAVGHLELARADRMQLSTTLGPLFDALGWLGDDKRILAVLQEVGQPDNAELWLGIAAMLEDHNMLPQAHDAYGRARLQAPADRRAGEGEARVFLLQGDAAAAGTALLALLPFYPDDLALLAQAARLARQGALPQASCLRTELLKRSDDDPAACTLAAMGDLLAGDAPAAQQVLRATVARAPSHIGLRVFLADVLRQQGDCRAAWQVLAPAAPSIAVWRTRARIAAQRGDVQATLRAVIAATGLSEDTAGLFNEAARLLLMLGYKRADVQARLRPLYSQAAHDVVHTAQAAVADALGDGATALAHVHRLAALRPDDAPLQLRLADLQARYGQRQAAVTLLENLVRSAPDDVTRLNALGFTLADGAVRLPEAAVLIRRAYRGASDDPVVLDSLGWLFMRQGRAADAVTWLQRAHAAAPDDAEVLRHLGDAYAAARRHDEARLAWQKALRLAPSVVQRQQLRHRLS